jgi:ABC-type nickel/cobalt efflux system permease component RcnA
MQTLSLIALGFFLGMRHATDPDHVVAVSTIVTRQQTLRGGVLIGGLWGVGHTLTILVGGGVIILFRLTIPPALGLTMEMTVALMLVGLGLWNVTALRRQLGGAPEPHSHAHQHGDYVHTHGHGHGRDGHGHRDDQTPQAWLDRHLGGLSVYQALRPVVVGVVHGLAGSAAVALLVLTTIGEPRWALAYLGVFGIGTILGMLLVTLIVAAPMTYAARRLTLVHRHLRLASGLVSLGFGLFLAYEIAVVSGLFTGTVGSPAP